MSSIRKTFADVKASRIPLVLGWCPDDPRVKDVVNEAQDILLSRGRWWGTYQVIAICVNEGCITWPRQVAVVESVDVCKEPIPIKNQWFEFIQDSAGLRPNDCCSQLIMVDRGLHPTMNDIRGRNKKLRVYPTLASDVGKRILFQGIDENNIPIRTKEGDEWIDGFYVTLALPYSDSTMIVTAITGVPKKDNTDGRVLVYQVDPVTTLQGLLAIYDPIEPTPYYRRSLIDPITATQCCGDACSLKTVTALVKLEFIPVEVDTDFLIIGNLLALKYECASIKKREADLELEAIALEKAAIRELNHELRTHTGDRTIVNVDVFGSAPLRRVFAGFR